MIKYILLFLIFVSCSLEFSDDKEIWDKGTINNENAILISYDGLDREYVLHVLHHQIIKKERTHERS